MKIIIENSVIFLIIQNMNNVTHLERRVSDYTTGSDARMFVKTESNTGALETFSVKCCFDPTNLYICIELIKYCSTIIVTVAFI